jgi:hypothetical protein
MVHRTNCTVLTSIFKIYFSTILVDPILSHRYVPAVRTSGMYQLADHINNKPQRLTLLSSSLFDHDHRVALLSRTQHTSHLRIALPLSSFSIACVCCCCGRITRTYVVTVWRCRWKLFPRYFLLWPLIYLPCRFIGISCSRRTSGDVLLLQKRPLFLHTTS